MKEMVPEFIVPDLTDFKVYIFFCVDCDMSVIYYWKVMIIFHKSNMR